MVSSPSPASIVKDSVGFAKVMSANVFVVDVIDVSPAVAASSIEISSAALDVLTKLRSSAVEVSEITSTLL